MLRKTLFAVASAALISITQAGAQIEATAQSGSFLVDGSPYSGGPILWFSLARITAGNGNPSVSSVTLSPQPNLPSNTRGRTVMRFFADGAGDLTQAHWQLPQDGDGGLSNAQAGETRFFSTWTSDWCIAPFNGHMFRSEVSVDGGASEAWVEVDIQEAPRPFLESVNGDFLHRQLDNGLEDRNSQSGQVLLDKNLTPQLEIDFTLPSFDMHRPNIFWQDFSETSSPYWDLSFSRMVVAFDGPNGFYTFSGPASDLVFFEPGESAVTKTIAGFEGTMSIDLNRILPGEYTVRYWAIPLSAEFSNGSNLIGCTDGFIPIEHVEMNVNVVPEPTTWLAMGAGLTALARRRRVCR